MYILNLISIYSGMSGNRGKERINNRKAKTEKDSGHEHRATLFRHSCHAVFIATSLVLVLSS